MTKHYTGIGSRQTPDNVLQQMTLIASALDEAGWILRSGGALGADTAFEVGATSERREIYLPWKGYNGHDSPLYKPSQAAFELAALVHPYWDRCDHSARKFHARNCHQVLGQSLISPSAMVICWTPTGNLMGGTATAMAVAKRSGIPVMNLATKAGMIEALNLVVPRLRKAL